MVDELDMAGRSVLVTGGTKGVGLGIAETFLERGANVMVCGRNEPESLPSAGGRTASFLAADVRDVDQIASLLQATTDAFGSLDVVVNNAGGTPPAFVAGTSPRFLASIINLNLIAPLLVAQQANDVMQGQPHGGAIINIGSVNGMSPAPGVAAYGAAKAGLLNLTQSLAVEFAPKVRVNQVTAGIIGTPEIFAQHYDNDTERIDALTQGIPMKRMTTPRDVGAACLFLASPLASNVAGANLLVHGGGDPVGALPDPPGGA
jgi:NAD(P)-dependent dehydrogenase (short-subunit alcohol dehydrogenase family)